jgi:hypothetical protein
MVVNNEHRVFSNCWHILRARLKSATTSSAKRKHTTITRLGVFKEAHERRRKTAIEGLTLDFGFGTTRGGRDWISTAEPSASIKTASTRNEQQHRTRG